MSLLRAGTPGVCKFYTGGITGYPEKELYREMAFLAYYYHWSREEILGLSHMERRRWCEEISAIHKAKETVSRTEKSILEWRVGQ